MKDYNFFAAYDKKKDLKIDRKSPYFIAVILLILAVLATGGLLVRNMMLEKDIVALRDETASIQASDDYKEAKMFQDMLANMDAYDQSAETILSDFEKQNVLGVEILDTLTAALPANTPLISLSVDHALMSAFFSIPDKKAGAELLLHLEKSGLFTEIHSPNIFVLANQPGYVLSVEGEMKAGESK